MPPPFPPQRCPYVDEGYEVCWILSSEKHETEPNVTLDYVVNWIMNDTHVQFKAASNTYGWQGLGWSRDGTMESGFPHPYDRENGNFGDLIMMFISGNEPYLLDCYAHERMSRKDIQQDLVLLSYQREGYRMTFEFVRKKYTGDIYRDYNFTDNDLTYMMWASSSKLPVDVTLESQKPFIVLHSWMEYWKMESWNNSVELRKEKMLDLIGMGLLGLGFLVIIFGLVTIGIKLRYGKSTTSADLRVNAKGFAPCPDQKHEDIELSISGSLSE